MVILLSIKRFTISSGSISARTRAQAAVQADVGEPALPLQRFDPVLLLTIRRLWTEVDIDRTIRVLLSMASSADAKLGLAVLQQRASWLLSPATDQKSLAGILTGRVKTVMGRQCPS